MDVRELKDKASQLFTKGKFAKAAETYEEYCAADRKDHQARLRCGDAWAKAGKKDKAAAAYSLAAEGFAKDGFLPRAIAASKLVLEIDPAHKGVQKMLAELYAQKSGGPGRGRAASAMMAAAQAPEMEISRSVAAPVTSSFSNRKDAIDLDAPVAKPKGPVAKPKADVPSPMNRADALELPEYEIPMDDGGTSVGGMSAQVGPNPTKRADAIEIEVDDGPEKGPKALVETSIEIEMSGATSAEIEIPIEGSPLLEADQLPPELQVASQPLAPAVVAGPSFELQIDDVPPAKPSMPVFELTEEVVDAPPPLLAPEVVIAGQELSPTELAAEAAAAARAAAERAAAELAAAELASAQRAAAERAAAERAAAERAAAERAAAEKAAAERAAAERAAAEKAAAERAAAERAAAERAAAEKAAAEKAAAEKAAAEKAAAEKAAAELAAAELAAAKTAAERAAAVKAAEDRAAAVAAAEKAAAEKAAAEKAAAEKAAAEKAAAEKAAAEKAAAEKAAAEKAAAEKAAAAERAAADKPAATQLPPGLKPRKTDAPASSPPSAPIPQSSPSSSRIWLPPQFTPATTSRPVSATSATTSASSPPAPIDPSTDLERSLQAFMKFDPDAPVQSASAAAAPRASFTELDLEGDSLLHAVEAVAARSDTPSEIVEEAMDAPDEPRTEPGALPKIPLFSDLPEDAFIALFERCPLQRFELGQLVFEQGDKADAFYVICAGRARVFRTDGDHRQELATLEEGSFFGEMALLSEAPRSASVEAADEDTQVLAISAEILTELSAAYPAVSTALKKFCRQRMLSNLMNTAALFAPFNRSDRRDLVQKFRARDVKKGDVIVTEGQMSDGLYVILSGEVGVDAHGKQIATLKEGQIFGEMSLLMRSPASATVSATRHTSLLRLPKQDFDTLILSHPQVLEHVSVLIDERKRADEKRASADELV